MQERAVFRPRRARRSSALRRCRLLPPEASDGWRRTRSRRRARAQATRSRPRRPSNAAHRQTTSPKQKRATPRSPGRCCPGCLASDRAITRPATTWANALRILPPADESAKRSRRRGDVTQSAASRPGTTSNQGHVTEAWMCEPAASRTIAETSPAGARTAHSSVPRQVTRAIACSRASPSRRRAQ